tara:strand:- start:84177 stop:86474 length:2298 start_codon:yes stop_codon:yes gene_type:complete
MGMKQTVAGLLIGASTLALTGAAFAQDEAPDDEVRSLATVVVQGEKVERSLQDTVSSVAVVSSETIEDRNLISLDDIFGQIANVTETYPGSGYTIRGISNRNVTAGGAAGLSTVFLDGSALPDAYTTGTPTDMWDVAQVEVLRGPQSTLQGRNTLAGAVIINTMDPTYEWDLRGRVTMDDHASSSYALAGGGPIIEDELAFRLVAEMKDNDGYINNPTLGIDEDASELTSGRLRLLWEPAAFEGFRAEFSYSKSSYEGGWIQSYANGGVDDYFENRVDFSDEQNTFNRDSDFASLNLSYELNDAFTLSAVTGWSSEDVDGTYDADYTADSIAYGALVETYDTFSQELRLNYSGESFEGLVGLYYSDRERDFLDTSITNVETPTSTISYLIQANGVDAATADYVAALYTSMLPVIPVDYYGDGLYGTENYAIFADGVYSITPQLDILAGFRYDYEEFTQSADTSATFAGTYPDPNLFGAPYSDMWLLIYGINLGVADLVGAASGSTNGPVPEEFEAFLPKLGVSYHWTDDLTTSFTVQKGYRSGGSTINIARATIVPYDQEFTWNYEASLRSVWLDGALTVNANAYYTDWTDQQVSVNFGQSEYDYHTVNAGSSSLYGFEIDANYLFSDEWSFYGALGHAVTEFDEFDVTVGGTSSDLSGRSFAFAPEWTSSVGLRYEAPSGFFVDGGIDYRSSQYSAVTSTQEDGEVDSRTLVNLNVGYDADTWRLTVFANNLLDEKYVQYNQVDTNRLLLGAPRVVGASLSFDF